jgi:2-hydroxychromene-2-carboxylate isomerase
LSAPEVIDYYFAPMSGYAYLGHARLLDIAAEAGVDVRYHPLDMLKVFAAAGSFPPAKYPAVRQIHRKADMARWARVFDLPINTTPAFWPVPMELACATIVAAGTLGLDQGRATGAVLSAVWEQNLNIADADDLASALQSVGLDPDPILNMASMPEIQRASLDETANAIDLGIFGSPTYTIGDEWFFGQDRLQFLSDHL